MDRQPLISIIVPVYNVEKYVGKCIDSILNQSYKNLEVILVDDGSTDGSENVCDVYASQHENITVIHQLNGGLSVARNTGLGLAKREYITFVDSDDMIHRVYVSALYKYIESERAEISAVTSLVIHEGDLIPTTAPRGEMKTFYSGVDAVESMLFQQEYIDNSACGKLFKAELFKEHRFPEGMLYEDLATIPYVCLEAKCIVAVKTPMYFYRYREDSILGRFSLRRSHVLDVVDDLVQNLSQKHPVLAQAACSRKFSANMNILLLMTATKTQDDALKARCWENICSLRKMTILHPKVRLKNKLGALVSLCGLDVLVKALDYFKDKISI